MATVDKNEIIAVLVQENFSDTVVITGETGANPPPDELLEFVSLSADQIITDIETTITGDNTNVLSVTIRENHVIEVFNQNILDHIPRGSSDKIDTPIRDDSFNDVNPVTRQVFNYRPDERTITVTFRIEYESSYYGLQEEFITQQVSNDYSIGAATLSSYI